MLPESPYKTTKERSAKYDALMPLLEAMYREFKEFAKKKPDETLSKQRVQVVNRLLKDILTVLAEEQTIQYLDLLDEEDTPENSDVLLMIGQFEAAMKGFHRKYWQYDDLGHTRKWNTKD